MRGTGIFDEDESMKVIELVRHVNKNAGAVKIKKAK